MAWYTVAMMRLWAISLTVVLALPAQALADDVTVLVVRHRWHTGIAFPADRLSPALEFLEPHFSEPSFYEFGWGMMLFIGRMTAGGYGFGPCCGQPDRQCTW